MHSSHDSRWKPWQRESRADIPQLSPKPLPTSHSLSGLPLPIQCQGPADCCPLSSIKAISAEVTRACRFTRENLHADPHLNFFSLSVRGLCWSPGQRWQDSTQLNISKLGITMPVLCWHYTPSLWPWSRWTLSCTVSMTTTQGRLLVTCVGGFACTEWELHNQLNRERVFGSAQQFETRINFMNLVMEQLRSMWRKTVRWLCFFSSRPASVILTHYIIAVDLTAAPAWDSQLCLRLAVG